MHCHLTFTSLAIVLSAVGCASSFTGHTARDLRELLDRGRYHEAMRELPRRMEEWRVREANAGHSFEGAAGFEYATVMFTIAEKGDSAWAAILDDPEIPHVYKTEMVFEVLETRLGKGAIYVGNHDNFIVPRHRVIDLNAEMIELPSRAGSQRLQTGAARDGE